MAAWWAGSNKGTRQGIRRVLVRAYGGWFQDISTSPGRFPALRHYQDTCPSTWKHDDTLFQMRFQFAEEVAVLDADSNVSLRITHTIATRDRAQTLKPHSGIVCHHSNCELPPLRKWIRKKRACTAPTCPHSFSAFFNRTEQKQVDVHLATDILLLGQSGLYKDIVIVSDDIDFTPALLAASATNRAETQYSVVRFSRQHSYADQQLTELGVRTITCQ